LKVATRVRAQKQKNIQTTSSDWEAFQSAVCGEWEGATSSFRPDGTVQPLPDYYVPDAYKEWGVPVVDWTHMTSALANEAGLSTTVKRFMPTVGCEADAIAYEEETVNSFGPERELEASVYSADGCYSTGPRLLGERGARKHRLEACIAGPSGRRVRVVSYLRQVDAGSPWQVSSIDVFMEGYVGEYEGGTDLRSCGGSSGYGEKPRLSPADLDGAWEPLEASYFRLSPEGRMAPCDPEEARAAPGTEPTDGPSAVCLPMGVWFGLQERDGRLQVEAGWLHEPETRCVVRQVFVGGVLSAAFVRREKRTASGSRDAPAQL